MQAQQLQHWYEVNMLPLQFMLLIMHSLHKLHGMNTLWAGHTHPPVCLHVSTLELLDR